MSFASLEQTKSWFVKPSSAPTSAPTSAPVPSPSYQGIVYTFQ